MPLGKVARERLDSTREALEAEGRRVGRILFILTVGETCNVQAFDSSGERVGEVRDHRIQDSDLAEVIALLR